MGDPNAVKTTFFGTSSVYVTDRTSSIFIDAFLSRPSLFRVAFGKLGPDVTVIKETLRSANISQCDGILVAHSHYDHVLDAPEVAKLLGSSIYGSESTLNVARGSGVGEDSLQLISESDVLSFGDFQVRIFEGLHSPGNRYPGTIDTPIALPTRAGDMKDGGCYSFYITHPQGSMLVHPSANFVPEKFSGLDVDVLYLGIGMLGAQPLQFQQDYWTHTVEATRPKLLIPIHWDDFFKPLGNILRPMPAFLDRFTASKVFIDRKVKEGGIDVLWQGPVETIAPFAAKIGARRDAASERIDFAASDGRISAWLGPLFNDKMVVTLACLGLLLILYRTRRR
jgi:L-ascorbate metabolism protein UlaG (beta-lactamase superfamily)